MRPALTVAEFDALDRIATDTHVGMIRRPIRRLICARGFARLAWVYPPPTRSRGGAFYRGEPYRSAELTDYGRAIQSGQIRSEEAAP